MRLVVQSFNYAKTHKRQFDAVISIEDPDARRRLRFHTYPRPDHLVLTFVDLDRPVPPPHHERPVFALAQREHVERALAFAEGRQSLLVHCQVGVGRSAAIGLSLLAARCGKGNERQALDQLLAIRPESVPNLHVVALADDILDLGGRLVEVVHDWEKDRPQNLRRRRLNRSGHFRYYGLAPDE